MDLPAYPEPEIKDLAADDVASILLDPSRTFSDFGELVFTPLAETVRQGILYYQQHGTLGEYTHLKIDREKA
jgi:hypothetical protein